MLTAVDTNILLDILVPNEAFADAAETAIEAGGIGEGYWLFATSSIRKSVFAFRRKKRLRFLLCR